MKTLLIMRHAKSSWSETGLSDFDRPLNRRGQRDAPRMGKLIRDEQLVPDRILTSTARRAEATTELVTSGGGLDAPVERLDDFYLAPAGTYIEILGRQSDEDECILVIGHNPGLESLLSGLIGEEETMPTAALAAVQLPISHWKDLRISGTAQLYQLWRPRDLQTP